MTSERTRASLAAELAEKYSKRGSKHIISQVPNVCLGTRPHFSGVYWKRSPRPTAGGGGRYQGVGCLSSCRDRRQAGLGATAKAAENGRIVPRHGATIEPPLIVTVMLLLLTSSQVRDR